jgi:hypothetical protein
VLRFIITGKAPVLRFYLHVTRLFVAKAQAIPAEPELDRVTQRRAADGLDVRPVAEPHFQKPPAQLAIAADRHNLPAAADS